MLSNSYHKNKGYCHQQNNRNFADFAEKYNKSLIEILKSKRPSIEPCGIPFTIFVQSLNSEPILMLSVRFAR